MWKRVAFRLHVRGGGASSAGCAGNGRVHSAYAAPRPLAVGLPTSCPFSHSPVLEPFFLPAPPLQREAGRGAAGLLRGPRLPGLPGPLLLRVRGRQRQQRTDRKRKEALSIVVARPRMHLHTAPLPSSAAEGTAQPTAMLGLTGPPPPIPPPPSGRQRDAFHAYWPAHRPTALRLMLLSSAVALCYNLAHSLMIRRISAVATTVVGEFKILALLLLSAFLLGEHAAPRASRGRSPCGGKLALCGGGRGCGCCRSARTGAGPDPHVLHLACVASWQRQASPSQSACTLPPTAQASAASSPLR